MALSPREQTSLGILLLVGILSLGGFVLVVPQVQAIQEKLHQQATLDQQVTELKLTQERMKTNIQDYQVKLDNLAHLSVRSYEPGALEKGIKSFLDDIVDLAAQSGNEIIGLTPYDPEQPANVSGAPESTTGTPTASATPEASPSPEAQAQPSTPPATDATATTDPAAEQKAAIEAQVDAKPIPLKAAGFLLDVRGSYAQAVKFLTLLKQYPNLLEIESFTLTNEAGPSRESADTSGAPGAGAGSHLNPNKPIKLAVKLRLFLMEAGQLASMGESNVPTM